MLEIGAEMKISDQHSEIPESKINRAASYKS